MKSCGNCKYWKKEKNEHCGKSVGQCSKGFYCIIIPPNRNEPYYLEKAVTIDDGNIACGQWCEMTSKSLICQICGHRSKPRFGKFWVKVEFIDKFRALICPNCKRDIPPNFYVTEDICEHDVISEHLEDFRKDMA